MNLTLQELSSAFSTVFPEVFWLPNKSVHTKVQKSKVKPNPQVQPGSPEAADQLQPRSPRGRAEQIRHGHLTALPQHALVS